MKLKPENILLSAILIGVSTPSYSEYVTPNFDSEMLLRKNIPQDFPVLKLPIKPIELDYSVIKNVKETRKIDVDAYHYISSDNSESLPKYRHYIEESPCLNKNIDICSPNEKGQAYEKYKADNFINGVIGQAQSSNKPLDKISVFDWMEKYMNESGDDYEPKILSAIENENVKGNVLLKEIAAHCVDETPSQDTKEYMKCFIKGANKNSNVFLNIKTNCLVEASKTEQPDVDFMSNLQSCTNRENLSEPMLAWLAFQSYRLGAIYYEQNANSVAP